MYDLHKSATIQVSLSYLSDMMTRQAQDIGYISEKEFIIVNSLELEEDELTAECNVFKYLEN